MAAAARDYCLNCGAKRIDAGIGLEPTPELYVERMVAVFREVRRVLRDDGTLWLNLGDSYVASKTGDPTTGSTLQGGRSTQIAAWARPDKAVDGLRAKQLIGIPWLVAFALQRDGWYLRSDIIWAKPNPMPESVRDRPTKAHEYIFLLSKSQRYFFDQDAVREPLIKGAAGSTFTDGKTGVNGLGRVSMAERNDPAGRNIRTVWTIATQPSPLPHFAAFPDELAERCIKAGCPKGGVVLDPFCGTGTTLKVARDLGRKAIGIELSEKYCALAVTRLRYGTKGAVAVSKGQESLWGGQVEMLDEDKQAALGKRTYTGFNERWKNR